jgi:hypothetical protein
LGIGDWAQSPIPNLIILKYNLFLKLLKLKIIIEKNKK